MNTTALSPDEKLRQVILGLMDILTGFPIAGPLLDEESEPEDIKR